MSLGGNNYVPEKGHKQLDLIYSTRGLRPARRLLVVLRSYSRIVITVLSSLVHLQADSESFASGLAAFFIAVSDRIVIEKSCQKIAAVT
jgi:hypothetical protein